MSSDLQGGSKAGSEQVNSEESTLIQAIGNAVSKQKAAFCCGGTVPIITATDEGKENWVDDVTGMITSPPVVIRWDIPKGKAIRKLTLPLAVSTTSGTAAVEELLKACEPATFGKKGEEVLDESYRKAIKLDSNQFSTSFSPHDVGILDVIAQSLLPGVAKPFSDRKSKYEEDLGVVAELYKLNIYSGPTGRFKPHVDTPRGVTQFGSLVVCLPHPHQGGSLRVTHEGENLVWDWGNENLEAIKWAAFYSDCEHEVMEVESGHRITLTYNLYVHERLGGLMRQKSVADKDSFSLHHKAKEALASKSFLKDGGTLGFYCRHAYAHANTDHSKRLPFALKGVDAIFYSVFYHLGLEVKIQAVMENLEHVDQDAYGYEWPDDRKGAELVATGLHGIKLSEQGGFDGDDLAADIVKDVWESSFRKDITWFNKPGPKEMAVVHLTYGNEPGITWHYSSAAILVDIPAFSCELRTKLAQAN